MCKLLSALYARRCVPRLDGATRVQIAAEARHARDCALTAASKDRPFEVDIMTGYDSVTALSPAYLDLVHRTIGSAGRLVTEGLVGAEYFANWTDKYGTAGQYLEIVAVCVMTVQADTFRLALGLEPRPLPAPAPGPPENPDGILHELAGPYASWVPTVRPSDVLEHQDDVDAGLLTRGYGGQDNAANIIRQLSALPKDHVQFLSHVRTMYISTRGGGPSSGGRNPDAAITADQVEFLAARVSQLNECAYW